MTSQGAGEWPTRWGERQCLSVQVVADVLRVQPPTVQRMLREGELIGFQVGPRRLWRVQSRDLTAFVEAATLRQEHPGADADET